eukprot:30677-Pelagococcus_subviridis.AAC.3
MLTGRHTIFDYVYTYSAIQKDRRPLPPGRRLDERRDRDAGVEPVDRRADDSARVPRALAHGEQPPRALALHVHLTPHDSDGRTRPRLRRVKQRSRASVSGHLLVEREEGLAHGLGHRGRVEKVQTRGFHAQSVRRRRQRLDGGVSPRDEIRRSLHWDDEVAAAHLRGFPLDTAVRPLAAARAKTHPVHAELVRIGGRRDDLPAGAHAERVTRARGRPSPAVARARAGTDALMREAVIRHRQRPLPSARERRQLRAVLQLVHERLRVLDAKPGRERLVRERHAVAVHGLEQTARGVPGREDDGGRGDVDGVRVLLSLSSSSSVVHPRTDADRAPRPRERPRGDRRVDVLERDLVHGHPEANLDAPGREIRPRPIRPEVRLSRHEYPLRRAKLHERAQHRAHVLAVPPDPRRELPVAPRPRAAFAVAQVAVLV